MIDNICDDCDRVLHDWRQHQPNAPLTRGTLMGTPFTPEPVEPLKWDTRTVTLFTQAYAHALQTARSMDTTWAETAFLKALEGK